MYWEQKNHKHTKVRGILGRINKMTIIFHMLLTNYEGTLQISSTLLTLFLLKENGAHFIVHLHMFSSNAYLHSGNPLPSLTQRRLSI